MKKYKLEISGYVFKGAKELQENYGHFPGVKTWKVIGQLFAVGFLSFVISAVIVAIFHTITTWEANTTSAVVVLLLSCAIFGFVPWDFDIQTQESIKEEEITL